MRSIRLPCESPTHPSRLHRISLSNLHSKATDSSWKYLPPFIQLILIDSFSLHHAPWKEYLSNKKTSPELTVSPLKRLQKSLASWDSFSPLPLDVLLQIPCKLSFFFSLPIHSSHLEAISSPSLLPEAHPQILCSFLLSFSHPCLCPHRRSPSSFS